MFPALTSHVGFKPMELDVI